MNGRGQVVILPHWSPSFRIVAYDIHRCFKKLGLNSHLLATRRFSHYLGIMMKPLLKDSIIFVGNFINVPFFAKYVPQARLSRHMTFYGVCEGPLPTSLRYFYELFDYIVVASKYNAIKLLEIGIKPTAIIPHAIDVKSFDRVSVRKTYSKVKLLSVISALIPRKGLNIYFQVLEELLRQDPKIRDKFEVVLKVPEAVNVPSSIRGVVKVMSGWLSKTELIMLYKECDIVVVPSLAEGFGIPIIEGFAACKPVISLNAPPMNELNSDRVGWLVKVQRSKIIGNREYFIPSIDDFVDKLRNAIESEDERREKSEIIKDLRWKYHYMTVYNQFIRIVSE